MPHDVRHLLVWDGKCLHRTAGDHGGRWGMAENIGKQRKTAGDGGGLDNVVRPRLGLGRTDCHVANPCCRMSTTEKPKMRPNVFLQGKVE